MGKTMKVRVRINKPETKITGMNGDTFLVDIAAKPENNRANIELARFLRKHFKQEVRIIRGLRSREKIILLSG